MIIPRDVRKEEIITILVKNKVIPYWRQKEKRMIFRRIDKKYGNGISKGWQKTLTKKLNIKTSDACKLLREHLKIKINGAQVNFYSSSC